MAILWYHFQLRTRTKIFLSKLDFTGGPKNLAKTPPVWCSDRRRSFHDQTPGSPLRSALSPGGAARMKWFGPVAGEISWEKREFGKNQKLVRLKNFWKWAPARNYDLIFFSIFFQVFLKSWSLLPLWLCDIAKHGLGRAYGVQGDGVEKEKFSLTFLKEKWFNDNEALFTRKSLTWVFPYLSRGNVLRKSESLFTRKSLTWDFLPYLP